MDESAAAKAPVNGLRTANAPVPLEGVSVDARIHDMFANVTITQRYRNREAQPIEAVYVFPLDEGAALCAFEAVVGDVHYVAQVMDREDAFKTYNRAIEWGHGAYLLDEERPDVFTASLGNVPPGAEVLLRLTYVAELVFEGDALRFMLPTTVSPRYAPAEDRIGIGKSEADNLSPPVDWSVPYGLDLRVTVDLVGPVAGIESPSHPVVVRLGGARATVTLAQRDVALDRDFVLLVTPAGAPIAHTVIERDQAGAHAIAVVFRPRFEMEQVPSEVVFLVDRSGSMDGSSIEEVRNALQICLRSLVPGFYFNIVGFGSSFERLFPESRPYDEISLAEASAHVASLQADLGGTDILPALEFTLRQPQLPGLARQVVVLTDGEVTNTDAVISFVRRNTTNSHVFTFGIGRGASLHLVRGMARAGRGVAEFIYPGERIDAKVMRQFERLMAPALDDVAVDWGGLRIAQSPLVPAPVFANGSVIVYGFANKVWDTTVTLTATGSAGPVSMSVPLDVSQAVPGHLVASLAARTRIRELEEGTVGLAARGSKRVRRAENRWDEAVRLATTYGLASRQTSLIAVEHRAAPVDGEIQLRRVPVALTSGWGEEKIVCRDMLYDLLFAAPPRVRRSAGTVLSPRPAAPAPPFQALVALQGADGSWELSGALAKVLGRRLRELETELRKSPGAGEEDQSRRAWATALALTWLEHRAAERRDEWRMLARKAERWLDAVSAPSCKGITWRDVASAFLSQ